MIGRVVCLASLALELAGCERTDPLAVVDQPHGTHAYYQVLVGDDEQFICVLPDGETLCEWEEADVIVTSMREKGDTIAEWSADGALDVHVKSGIIARRSATSRDGEVPIRIFED